MKDSVYSQCIIYYEYIIKIVKKERERGRGADAVTLILIARFESLEN